MFVVCAVPSAPPHDVQCSALTSQSLQIRWQPPSLGQTHGLIQGYKIFYEPAEEAHGKYINVRYFFNVSDQLKV